MRQPQFSVVIPTRDRPATLFFALQTCLQQEHADYEVIVSDNHGSPATRAVVDQFACERLRYVRAPEPLAMSENWNLALAHTRGEYIIYIGDDDALMPHALGQLAALLARNPSKALTWFPALYSWPTFVIPEEANVLVVPLLRAVDTVHAKTQLQEILANRVPLSRLPNIYHGLVHREIIERTRRPDDRVFTGIYPDTVTSISFAYVAGDFVSATLPFSVSGFSGASNTMAARLKFNDHPTAVDNRRLNAKAGNQLHPWVPDLPGPAVVLADSFLQARANLFPEDEDLVLDRRLMATSYLEELPFTDPEQRRQGIDRIRDTLRDSSELLAWFDSLDLSRFAPASSHVFQRKGPGFDGHNLTLDMTAFGIQDVAAAARCCADILHYPSQELPPDLPCFRTLAHSRYLLYQEMERKYRELHATHLRAVEEGALRNVPRRILRKVARLIRG